MLWVFFPHGVESVGNTLEYLCCTWTLRNNHGEQKFCARCGSKGMEGRSHTVTDETCTCFYTSPVAQLETHRSMYGVLATQLSEFPGGLRLPSYSN